MPTFRGKRYRLASKRQRGQWGSCDPPTRSGKTICLDPDPQPKGLHLPKGSEKLWLALHEGLHACFWDLDEQAVSETSVDLARFLWRLGYRAA